MADPDPAPAGGASSTATTGGIEGGIGAGVLSAAAQARLARTGPSPLRPPGAHELAAVASWRASIHAMWLDGDPEPESVGHHAATIGGVRCLRAERPTEPPRPTMVYLHGGGFALGSPEVAVPITERLARAVDVVSVDYRLAPEHPYPAAVTDARAVLRAVANDGAGSVLVGGDSAGANIALSAVLDEPDVAVAGLVLLSPHLDHGGREVGTGRATDPLSDVDADAAAWLRSAYCGTISPDDGRVSPLRRVLAGLPPVLIQVGGGDGTLSHAVRFARRARRAHVEVTLDVWDGLWHTWHYHRELPEADEALAEVTRFALERARRLG